MIELLSIFKVIEMYSNSDINEGLSGEIMPNPIPISWMILALVIAFGTAYIAYSCNEYETPATRAITTVIAFLFSGIYLIYYFIVHVIFDRKCGSRGINNIIRNMSKKK